MKHLKLVILLLLCIVAVTACGQNTDPTAVLEAYFEALESGDVDEAQTFVADDATFEILGEVITGKEQIQVYNQAAMLGDPGYDLSNIQVDGDRVTYTNTITFNGEVYNLKSEAIIQNGKIISIIDRSS